MSDLNERAQGRLYDSIISSIDGAVKAYPDNEFSSRSAIWDKIFDRRASPKQFESFVRMLDASNDTTLGIANLSEPRFYAAYEKLFEGLFSREEVERVTPGTTGNPTLIHVHGIPSAIPVLQNETRIRQLHPYLPTGRKLRVLEIGAGYGGMANLLLKRGVVESYTVVDLPDNLAISAFFLPLENPDYTARVCPDQIDDEPGHLNFLLPSEIGKVKGQSYDLVINCDSLGEMPASVARAYVDFISQRLSINGIFYTKNGVQRGPGTCARLSDYGFEKFEIVDIMPTPFSTGMLDDHSTVLVLKRGQSELSMWRSLDLIADLFKFGLAEEITALPQRLIGRSLSPADRQFLHAMEQLFSSPSRASEGRDYGEFGLEQAHVYMAGLHDAAFGAPDMGQTLLERYRQHPLSALAESQAVLIGTGGTGEIVLDDARLPMTRFYLSTTKIPIVADPAARAKFFRAGVNRAKARFTRVPV